jgi:hypothetical protein
MSPPRSSAAFDKVNEIASVRIELRDNDPMIWRQVYDAAKFKQGDGANEAPSVPDINTLPERFEVVWIGQLGGFLWFAALLPRSSSRHSIARQRLDAPR